MKKGLFTLLLTTLFTHGVLFADEGMWLLQLMKEQNLEQQMRAKGLVMSIDEIYSPDAPSLKDVVGIFGGGCTGEIISPNGLIITNHHCGYGKIQQLSSLEHNYLKDGFWSQSFEEEIPAPGLSFTFVEKIEDVTDLINEKIEKKIINKEDAFSASKLQEIANAELAKTELTGKSGISASIKPYFAGNKYYMFIMKNYPDVRLVATPPSSIGKFGGETDNWMWPRHTGDFSLFRIYADSIGNPIEYSKNNVPLKRDKHLPISLNGFKDGDFAMILGFPGSTSRFLTLSEVKQRMYAKNEPVISIRDAALTIIRDEMEKSEKVAIQYANKLASISNYWKNSIGMNKAIIDNKVLENKNQNEVLFRNYAKKQNNKEYETVISEIDKEVESISRTMYLSTLLSETMNNIEFLKGQNPLLQINNKTEGEELSKKLKEDYNKIHNRDYDHRIDKRLAKSILPLYISLTKAEERTEKFNKLLAQYKENSDKLIDNLYNNSILSSEKNLNKFLKNPSEKNLKKDIGYQLIEALRESSNEHNAKLSDYNKKMNPLHKTYIKGLLEMAEGKPIAPDANFTLRMTYGNVKSYQPRDGVKYNYYTTLKGVIEKENSSNMEFTVPAKLKKLYKSKDYGPYAQSNGEMTVAFLTTNDITGGNSGSPVINAKGELLGLAFDGNWESLSSDLNFDKEKQRCINVDIRYVLFVIDKLGECKRLINEMTIVE